MNGVVIADALTRGDQETAREALDDFWVAVNRAGMASPLKRTPLDVWLGNWSLDHSPAYVAKDLMSRRVSPPPQFNPLNLNPLREIVAERVDFERVRCCPDPKLFVAATNVCSGKQRIFTREEMSLDAVMASACLPTVFQAVEIDGEAYWDGGYMGNPSLMPLMEHCGSRDIVIVQVNPIHREELPTSAAAIMNRLNEITFNAALIKEVRLIALLQRLLGDQGVDIGCYADTFFHRIAGDATLGRLSVSSKLNAEWPFLCYLRDEGRRTAESWLAEHFEALGSRSTLDVESVYRDTEASR
jgi:NTE family protein